MAPNSILVEKITNFLELVKFSKDLLNLASFDQKLKRVKKKKILIKNRAEKLKCTVL